MTKQPQDGGNGADDVKERMRQALQRKREQSHPSAPRAGTGASGNEKMHGIEGHIPTQMHRRKAGGGGA
ncbi:hypothetical protein GC722_16315 [Auraticoccus sp. F435]|uniref:DUF5302 domain-containing protein n=1 Tax=Auraticoccus cholistanensis TaxID=2656650 RepID=A0A6A9V1X5_9ACTN|nr:DUF5302 family protein [Auraticoccus cholistanensis]MVA77569.1 hypothetical protein [Auraticoccus cholistanensis]